MKRFTETGIWDKLWFRKLTPRLKALWKYLCDRCDPAGVMDADWEAAQFYIGEPCSEADLEHFNGNAVMRQGKVFLPQFIEFQYGKLSAECKPHDKVFEAMRRNGLKQGEFKLMGASVRPLIKPPPEADPDFETFWSAYPRKVGKVAAMKAWGRNGRPELSVILSAVEAQKSSDQWRKDGGRFIPHPSTWLNGRRWQDELRVGEQRPKPPPDVPFKSVALAKDEHGNPIDGRKFFVKDPNALPAQP